MMLSLSAPRAEIPLPMADRTPALGLTLNIHGDERAVRDALAHLRAYLGVLDLPGDLCGSVEIVMAEALNNVIEHAYAPACEGPVQISAMLGEDGLDLRIIDEGRPLPQNTVPQGDLPPNDVALEALPDGGFGWYLIHTLADAVSYDRADGRNILRFRFGVNPAGTG